MRGFAKFFRIEGGQSDFESFGVLAMTEQSPAEAIFFAALEKGTAEERIAYSTPPAAMTATYGDGSNASSPPIRRSGAFWSRPPKGVTWPRPPPFRRRRTCLPIPARLKPCLTTARARVSGLSSPAGTSCLRRSARAAWAPCSWRNRPQPVKRLVALKLIKLGMDSRQVLARFEAERQALALMDHPNIAKVLDAGATDSGRPFFVMELVKGVPITRFCDEHQLSPASGWSCSSRSARRSSTPTRRASSTATSSQPTCWSPSTTTGRCRR